MHAKESTYELSDVKLDIVRKTREEIEAFISTIGKSRVFEGVSKLTANVSDDYGDRFLVELIQNAHDAHSANRSDGVVEIHLDTQEGSFGCLYVANGGAGFARENLEAITNIALSSKSVNAGAGNKGLGFRSILRICDHPEIYSSHPGSKTFDGYCFGFPADAELERLLVDLGHAEHVERMLSNMPQLFLPVVRNVPARVAERFEGRGLSTVVRLPLVSEEAKNAVIAQLAWVEKLEVPIHLFLSRIARITASKDDQAIASFERRIKSRDIAEGGVVVEVIGLDDAEFVVAHVDLDDAAFRKELDDCVKAKSVPGSWKNWVGAARVSVAVPINREIHRGRLFCFLPMGEEADAPLHGFIDANFYTPIDRRRLHPKCRLNDYFLERAAQVAWIAARHLIAANQPWTPQVVVDLICWMNGGGHKLIEKHGAGSDVELKAALVLPAIANIGGHRWAPVGEMAIWRDEAHPYIKAAALAKATSATLASPDLGFPRIARLEKFLTAVVGIPRPSTAVIATWIEGLALHLRNADDQARSWESFYAEIASLFRFSPTLLLGKSFLRADDGTLFPPDTPQDRGSKAKESAKLFFPPAQQGDEDGAQDGPLDIQQLPDFLKSRFAFVDGRIAWIDAARRQTDARKFLEGSRFVREYQTRDVLRSLAEVTRDAEVPSESRLLALVWAYKVWAAPRFIGRGLAATETKGANLAVPCEGGWREASRAYFGSGWNSKGAALRLHQLLQQIGDRTGSLADARESVLLSFAKLGVTEGGHEDWAEFLTDAGVSDCLRPFERSNVGIEAEGQLLAWRVSEQIALTAPWRACWFAAIGDHKNLPNPFTIYRATGATWILPGMEAFEDLTEPSRSDLAHQFLRSFHLVPDSALRMRVLRPERSGAARNEEHWLSPIALFFKEALWLRTRTGNSSHLSRPSDAWLVTAIVTDLPPSFLPTILPETTRLLERDAVLLERFRTVTTMRVYSDPRDSRALVEELSNEPPDVSTGLLDVRRYRDAFAHAWGEWIKQPFVPGAKAFTVLPVVVAGRFVKWALEKPDNSAIDDVAYLLDENDPLKRHLIDELEVPTFPFEGAVERTAVVLDRIAPGRFALSSRLDVVVLVDGVVATPGNALPALTELAGDWLADVLVCAASKKGGAFFRSTQRTLSELRAKVDRLRVLRGALVRVRIGTASREIPRALEGTVLLQHELYPTLVFQGGTSLLTWKELRGLSRALAEAVGNKVLEGAFEIVMTRLREQQGTDDVSAPTQEEIATAVGADLAEIADLLETARAGLHREVILLRPMIHLFGLQAHLDELDRFQRGEGDSVNIDGICADLAGLVGIGVTELKQLLGRANSLQQLGADMRVDLSLLNACIKEIGHPYQEIDMFLQHQATFRGIVNERRAGLVDSARSAFADVFDSFGDLARYRGARDLAGLDADPAWGRDRWTLTDEDVSVRLSTWRATLRENAEETAAATLQPLEEIREANRAALRDFADTFSRVVPAWAWVHKETCPDLWAEPTQAKQRLLELSPGKGWMDFRKLDHVAIGRWLLASSDWPTAMPVTIDLLVLGLKESDVNNLQSAAEKTQAERRRQRTIISFAGREISALEAGYQDLVQAVHASLSAATGVLTATDKFADLEIQDYSERSSGGGSGGINVAKGDGDASMSDEQRRAIGLVGELLAYEWLKKHYQEAHDFALTDTCWVSSNGRRALGIASTDDTLGFDFKVELKSATHFWEVKATSGNKQLLELGPTEIVAAQKYKRDRGSRYRILYITNVLDPKAAALYVLPNPFSSSGSQLYDLVGKGSVKYKFDFKK